MRFSYVESMCDPSFYLPLARAAEEAGYTSFAVPDSLGFPKASDTKYPYTPDGDNAFLAGKPFLEPFSLIPAMGAVTERLRFTTFVLKLPVRLPYLVAKSATSVAVLTGNRLGLGVGVSPWPEDFQVSGQDWKSRGKRMDEMIEIIRGLATGEFYAFRGEHYEIESIQMCPVPTQPIPILIGGHSEPALRRAARLGDGWMHAGGDPDELKGLLTRLRELRAQYGRDKEPFELHVISMDAFSLDGIHRLEDLATVVGEGGTGLSGGQLQRIVIARAILKNPRILIFDEATSQIDADSESKIHKAIQEIMAHRTTLIIAHRFSTVIAADQIVVVNKGQILAKGTHAELMLDCSLYQGLYETQLVK